MQELGDALTQRPRYLQGGARALRRCAALGARRLQQLRQPRSQAGILLHGITAKLSSAFVSNSASTPYIRTP